MIRDLKKEFELLQPAIYKIYRNYDETICIVLSDGTARWYDIESAKEINKIKDNKPL